MSNPNNNKHFNDEALRINRMLKKENDALKLEIKSLWADISEVEKQLANYKKTFTIDEIEDVWFSIYNEELKEDNPRFLDELEQQLK